MSSWKHVRRAWHAVDVSFFMAAISISTSRHSCLIWYMRQYISRQLLLVIISVHSDIYSPNWLLASIQLDLSRTQGEINKANCSIYIHTYVLYISMHAYTSLKHLRKMQLVDPGHVYMHALSCCLGDPWPINIYAPLITVMMQWHCDHWEECK